MVECDIRLSKDGVLTLAHDEYVTDIFGTRFLLSEHTAEELGELDLGAGEGAPTLTQLVEDAHNVGFGIMADMKTEGNGVEAMVCDALAALPVEKKVVPGALAQSRTRFRAYNSNLPLSLTLSAEQESLLGGEVFEKLVDSLDTEAVTWEYPLLTLDRIQTLQERGIQVYAWTVDSPPEMERLIAAGVDGIISNRCDLLLSLLQRA